MPLRIRCCRCAGQHADLRRPRHAVQHGADVGRRRLPLQGAAADGKGPPSANPATVNCAALDGSSQFGLAGSSGGWVTDDRPDEVFNLCAFPDLSFIDEFGIFYYAGGVVRGQDLSKVMRYHPAVLPNFFPH